MATQIAESAVKLGWLPTSLIVLGAICSFLYALSILALPTPIPGIPYNKVSAKRLFGDIPEFGVLERSGKIARLLWSAQAVGHQSAITQVFLGPFAKPAVVISDFREAQDLMVRRGNDLGRGRTNRAAWGGIAPEHFIAMEDHDKRFKDTKGLLNDLMTPKFLHEVNCPASYEKVLDFIQLWQQKTNIAEGCAFNASQDLSVLTYDIILAALLGLDAGESEIARNRRRLQDGDISAQVPDDKNALCSFPEPEFSNLQHALRLLADAAGKSFAQPSKRLFHYFNNRTASMKQAFHWKKSIVQEHIDRSSQRLEREGDDFEPRSALDYIVSREAATAKKAGRAPEFDSDRLSDIIFGYLVGGQDSTHSTLSFLVKYLGQQQEQQKKLRDVLRQAYPETLERREQPKLSDILKTPVPYLDAFIEEVLRMSDPTMAVSKETLCDMDILGHAIPKGTIIILCLTGPSFSQRGLPVSESVRSQTSQKHKAERLGDWAESDFPISEFHPERWLRPSDAGTGKLVYDSQAGPFLAFSSGKRGCWGQRLAYLELKLVATLFVWNFIFESLPSHLHDWKLEDGLFVKAKNCRVKLRSTWEAEGV